MNFYGFRKIKSDALRLKDEETNEESAYQKFKHEKFQKNRPDLLFLIRKTNHTNNDSAEKQDVEALKMEVRELKSNLAWVTDDLIKLKALVSTLLKNQQIQQANEFLSDELPETTYKKRKIADVADPLPILSGSSDLKPGPIVESSLEAVPVIPTGFSTTTDIDFDYLDQKLAMPPPPPPERFVERDQSTATTASLDQDVLASIFALDPSDELSVFDGRSPSTLTSNDFLDLDTSASLKDDVVDAELVDKVRDALAMLPPEMRVMFVDRLTTVIGNPDGFAKQVDAVTQIAAAAASEAQRRLVVAGHSPNDKHMLPLASAVLGAYMQRYLEQQSSSSASSTFAFLPDTLGSGKSSSAHHSFPEEQQRPLTEI